jgi:carboxymethylenebutenolidase
MVDLGYSQEEFGRAFDYFGRFDVAKAVEDITASVGHLKDMEEVGGKHGKQVAALGYCLGGKLAYLAAAHSGVDAAIGYYGVRIDQDLDLADRIACPLLLHFGGADEHVPMAGVEKIKEAFAGRDDVMIAVYEGAPHAFANRFRETYSKPAASMAHSRTVALLRATMGPVYDLNHLWDMHCYFEFLTREVDATMATMVAEPYVNHIPTMTGGVGYTQLHRFYKNHFVNSNPDDTTLIPISRTIGADRVVDEMVFCFTHDREIDWMLPGIAPTGKYVEIPLVAIVKFRGDKLYHEHIYWDQASVLVQIGVLDPQGLPVAGRETAAKLLDETLPSNRLMATWAQSEGR